MNRVLDATSGARMMWFDKNNSETTFMDNRKEVVRLSDGRALEITPDVVADFCNMPFKDETFNLVVFDPPHLKKLGKNSDMAKKYGVLNHHWRTDIQQGLKECVRVLKKGGTLIFKWNEYQIPFEEIEPLLPLKPLFGHRSGKGSKTIWMTFLK